MSGQYRCLPAVFLATFGVTSAQAAEKSQSTCMSGDLVRRVVVEVGDLSTSLPCEVIYWKDSEAPGERRVLWNARTDAAFCDKQAASLVDKLAAGGWSCSANDGAAAGLSPSGIQAPSNAGTSATPALSGSATIVPNIDAATTARVQPITPASQTGRPYQPIETNSTTIGTLTAPGIGVVGSQQTAALTPEAPPSSDLTMDQLKAVIETNLSRLNQTVDGDFEAKIGEFGDLNNDGIEDAVVFFNYESSAADFTQFVAAYLFNGENYRLAATKPVGGTDLAVREVQVEDISEGSIELRLVLNDASQTDNRRAVLILKDGQLVETQ